MEIQKTKAQIDVVLKSLMYLRSERDRLFRDYERAKNAYENLKNYLVRYVE